MTNDQIAEWLEKNEFQVTSSLVNVLAMKGIVGFKREGLTIRLFTDFEFSCPTKSPFWQEIETHLNAIWDEQLTKDPPSFSIHYLRPSNRFVKLTGGGFHSYYFWLIDEWSVVSTGMAQRMLAGALANLGCLPPTRLDVVNPETFDMGFEAANDEDHMVLSCRGGINEKEVAELFFENYDAMRTRIAELDAIQSPLRT